MTTEVAAEAAQAADQATHDGSATGADSANGTSEAVEGEGASAGSVEGQQQDDAQQTKANDPPKRDWVQARINELTRKRHEEVERANARAQAAEAELTRLRQAQTDPNASQSQESQPISAHELAEVLANQRLEKIRFDERCNNLVNQGKQELGEKFEEAMSNLGSLGAFFEQDARTGQQIPTSFTQALLESEKAPAILAHLGQNKQEAARILSLTPMQQAREIGRIEAQLATPKPPPVSSAPAPVTPVGSGASAVDGPSDKDDDATWLKKRNEQLAAKRRR
ncbi:hypothetical protein FP568_15680 [Pandoraea pnomenusa]|uniref:hypothetical protein n=1 Tax=Pandoraea pnomenusa TaxID=93220 RepID=UPI0011986009|nr:hypothetical protein [Pandoraea pnomenusa]QDX22553.1 hypothetical protein FP568_15680 [Pandoraea pnomenusa]